jgi:hypothetical protein
MEDLFAMDDLHVVAGKPPAIVEGITIISRFKFDSLGLRDSSFHGSSLRLPRQQQNRG